VPKAFVRVATRTLIEHAALRLAPAVRDLVVVVPGSHVAEAQELLPSAVIVAGGHTRQESVSLGLAVLSDDVDLVLVHDAARAFVPSDVVARVVQELRAGADAVIPVVPLTDTIRAQGAPGELGGTVDRRLFVTVQTPQGFLKDVIVEAHRRAQPTDACDDASLAEAIGVKVVGVTGSELAFKITRPVDLLLARSVAAS
jgi:2-C-methyl-D-erythritol 4-phosphate cytidylyltransferase